MYTIDVDIDNLIEDIVFYAVFAAVQNKADLVEAVQVVIIKATTAQALSL
jgi:hypothetical protein